MSLLMEALKKAEQSKQNASTETENNLVSPIESTQKDPSTQVEPDNILDIEDPNSAFNEAEELEWHFDLDEEDIEPIPPEPEIKNIDVEAVSLELESIQIEPDETTTHTPLLEQADQEPLADIPKNVTSNETENVKSDTILDTQTTEPSISDISPQSMIEHSADTPSTKTNHQLDTDGLDWDTEIFVPDISTINTPNSVVQTDTKRDASTLKANITKPDVLTAKRVLLATAPSSTNHRRSMVLIIILLILLLTMGGGYYAYQFNMSNSVPLLADFASQSTQAIPASTQPPIVLAAEKIDAPQANAEVSTPTLMQKAQTVFSKVVTDTRPKISTPPQNERIQTVQQPESFEKPITVAQVIAKKQANPIQTKPVLVTKSLAKSLNESRPKPLPQQKRNKAIQITKNRHQEKSLDRQTKTAYQAFQQGHNVRAKRLYQQILQRYPKNRDALLGLAAIAQRQSQNQTAQYYYQQVLQYYPQDKLAQMGLNAVQALPVSESQIKILLEQSPTPAYLHFNLGNTYAKQKRWREAQQAYFDAYRLNEQKADYAYNLAVSLEYLRQSKAALPFYQKALQLGQNQAIQFNPEQVKKRIQQLID